MSPPVSILIVEDHEEMRDLLAMYLSRRYDCAAGGSAEEAIRLLEERTFDIVLTDVELPGSSGFSLCRLIHGRYPQTAAIVMSATPNVRYELEATRRHAFEYLMKPFTLEQLDMSIGRALRHRSFFAELNSLVADRNRSEIG